MKIVEGKITIAELKEMSQRMFGNLVKAVVDIAKEKIAVDGELHSDLAEFLIEDGSRGDNLWGINIYPNLAGEERIEFNSIINLKPHLDNRSRGVENQQIKQKVISVKRNQNRCLGIA